jgi:AAA family ATP:ADP antiporter
VPSRLATLMTAALRPFARIEPGEVVTAAILTATVFLLLTAYYLLKTAREPLILLSGGAEVKSYTAAGQAILLLAFVRVYGTLAKRLGRLKILTTVYTFFASNLVIFAALSVAKVSIGVPFYLWVGVFNYTTIAQFWAFAADVYTPDQGKRLFAILGIGSSLGAVVGARFAGMLVADGPFALMLAAGALLLVCVGLIAWVDLRSRKPGTERTKATEEPLTGQSPVALLMGDRYLLLLAALTLVLNWINSNGEYLLDRTLLEKLAHSQEHGDPGAFIGRFKADYFAWVNLIGVVLQLFAVSRILSRLGVRAALYFLPFIVLLGNGVLVVAPTLALIRLAKIAENSTDYSIQNTARQALYLVATRPEKFVGKTAVDTFFVRFGDVLSAALVWLGARLGLSTVVFAFVNLCLVAVWVVVLTALGREHRRRSEETARLETAVEVSDGTRLVKADVPTDLSARPRALGDAMSPIHLPEDVALDSEPGA